MPDPVDGEFLVSPECLLGKCGGIKFDGGDCDDLAAGLAAALLSVGVRSAIVGQAYAEGAPYEHVIAAAWCGSRWWRADPTNETYKLGEADAAAREIWIDVMTGETLCEGECDQMTLGAPPRIAMHRQRGDFVGVHGSEDVPTCTVTEGSPATPLIIGTIAGAGLGLLGGWLLFKR